MISLREKILRFQPVLFCFNGKKAANVFFETKDIDYGFQNSKIGKTTFYVLPSTSGAANGYWDITYWDNLSKIITTTKNKK